MKRRNRRLEDRSALDLVEEATHLLRTSPSGTLAMYYLGAVPFVLGALFFWADASRNPFAGRHVAEASLGVALLFLWMKFWQAHFTRFVRARVAGDPPPAWTVRGCLHTIAVQSFLQPLGLVPLGIFAAIFFGSALFAPYRVLIIFAFLPFAWVLSFFQNVTALDDSADGAWGVFRKAWRHLWLWPGQNILTLAIVLAFGLFIFLDLTVVGLLLPELGKMLLGVQSVFTRGGFALLNTTFFAAVLGLTYLCVDPILKIVYALRCFYGESLQSGEDLKADLKQFSVAAKPGAIALILWLAFAGMPATAHAAEGSPAPAAPVASQGSTPVAPPDLDRAIDDTIHGRKYTWRMPREEQPEKVAEDGPIAKFFKGVQQTIGKAWKWFRDTLKKLFQRKPRPHNDSGSSFGYVVWSELLLYALVAVAVVALIWFLYRLWRGSREQPIAVATEALQPTPDLTQENVDAGQLPEDGWTRLARELLERGEFRLALRAFYLASLAHLAARNLIQIARFKSNRDYERELRRRGHSLPALLSMFDDNVSIFERIWYGMHDVNRDLVQQFAANVERIRTAG